MTDVIKSKKCLIFDLDGTLIDSLAMWVYAFPQFETLSDAYSYFKPLYSTGIPEKPGASAFLSKLHNAGYKIYIATATNLSVCGGCIKRLGFDKYIDGAFCCKDFNTNKQSPDFYNKVLEKTGFKKNEAVIFEDNASWARVAYNAGFDIIGVRDRHTDDINEFHGFAVACIDTFDEINI